MANAAFTAGVLWIAFELQYGLLPMWGVTGPTPNLVWVIVLLCAVHTGPVFGMLTGALSGMVLDVLFSSGMGLYTLPMAIMGTLLGWYAPKLSKKSPGMIALFAAGTQLVLTVFILLVGFISLRISHPTNWMWIKQILTVLLSGAAAFLLCVPLRAFYLRRERKERQVLQYQAPLPWIRE